MPWPMVPFGELAEFRNGLNYTRDNHGNGLKVINVGDFGDRFVPDIESLGEINPNGIADDADFLQPADMLFVRSNGNRELIGRVMYMDNISYPIAFSAFCIRARIAAPDALPKFYAYYFRSGVVRNVLSSIGGGASIANLNQGILNSFAVPLPDKKTQEAVVERLDALESLLANCKRRIGMLEEAARLIYTEWFVRLRFPESENTPKNNGIPFEWSKGVTSDFIDVLSGGTPHTKTAKNWDGEIQFFTPADAPDYFYVTETEKHLSEEGLNACNSRLFPKNTVFITARGTVGKIALAQKPMAMNQSCYALRTKDGSSQLFLLCAMQAITEHFKQAANGGVFDTIVVDTFRRMPITWPSREVIDQFDTVVAPIFGQIETLLLQVAQLRQARDLLLPRLISGQLRL